MRPLAPAALLAALLVFSCDKFNGPPEIAIIGLKDGRLSDNKAPVEVAFSEPIDPASLQVKIVRVQTDAEGNLEGDPGAAPGTVTPVIFSHRPGADEGGTAELLDNNTRFRITVDDDHTLPVGPSLALLIEPGLRDLDGIDTKVRRRIPFGYGFSCTGTKPSGAFVSGQYYFLVSVTKPLGLQVQLIGAMRIDPATGAMVGQFTNADRNPDYNRCSPPCAKTEACQTLPAQRCVSPSEKAATADEFVDYVANNQPPFGYSFPAKGCAEEQSPGVITFGNEPVDAEVQVPKLTIKGIVLSGSFSVDPQGVLRGSGTFTAEQVLIGTSPSGAGEGTFTARLIPKDQEPPGTPQPP